MNDDDIRGGSIGLSSRSSIGKTTIFKMVVGLITPDSGAVVVRSLRIGYIFQEPRLIRWKTALENICFGLRAIGLGNNEAKEIGTMMAEDFRNCRWIRTNRSKGCCERDFGEA
ncbi:MAG: ATP-binding cassette domain-containing protein [Methanosarcinales archaeon]|nr:MAG: ATP-binding cassette domain-containing protein [Methanosarcinales archaeon]